MIDYELTSAKCVSEDCHADCLCDCLLLIPSESDLLSFLSLTR